MIIGKNILLSVAPRRDWFIEGGKNLENLDRVYGATEKKSTKVTKDVLSIVCKKLHEASSYKVSEMVKSVKMLIGIWISLLPINSQLPFLKII